MTAVAVAVPAEAALLGDTGRAANWTVDQGGTLAEIIDGATSRVWLCQTPMTHDEFEALDLPDGFAPVGIGRAVADVAYFRRSPGAPGDGPVETMTVCGREFSLVAVPGERAPGPQGVMILPVDKCHSMWFRAGRTIEILDIGDGSSYIPQTAGVRRSGADDDGAGRRGRALPDGWAIREVTLDEPLTVHVDNPAMTYWFGDGSSFQGPVALDL